MMNSKYVMIINEETGYEQFMGYSNAPPPLTYLVNRLLLIHVSGKDEVVHGEVCDALALAR